MRWSILQREFSVITLHMTQKILRLPENVVNQIAAGEVVENPASIVKELIENSIDAGACRIAVEINGGGQQLIRIEDDGCGMDREDAVASIERHATSKIRSVDDLSSLATMGFRGEALAAIAAVSQFEMMTATQWEATRIVVEGGRTASVEPCARNRGTTIWIRSLFYNVPARKKFQKSVSANASQVKRTVEALSLAHPEIGFSLISQGKKIIETVGTNGEGKWKRRVEETIEPYEHEIHFEKEGIRIYGFAAAPEKAMANRSGQHLFINRRFVFSPLISRAVKEGFATRIDTASHPAFVLYIEISPDQVDVNVHPQKKEVRFQNEGMIFRLVQDAVSSAFSALPFSPVFPTDSAFSFYDRPIPSLPWEAPSAEFRSFVSKEEPKLDLIYPERILVVSGNFLLLQKEGLVLIDLRAAHARVLFESLAVEKGASQALIWPLEIELGRGDHQDCVHALNRMGIECRLLGEKTLAVDALPPFLEAADFPLFFANWKEGKEIGTAATRFCRGLKKSYSLEEAERLWRRLQGCSDRCYDPSGHPIWIEIKDSDFEKLMAKKSCYEN